MRDRLNDYARLKDAIASSMIGADGKRLALESLEKLKAALVEALDEWDCWMSVAGMDGADGPTPEDFRRLKELRGLLASSGSAAPTDERPA